MSRNNRRNDENSQSSWIAGAVGAGLAGVALAGGAYWLAGRPRAAPAPPHAAPAAAAAAARSPPPPHSSDPPPPPQQPSFVTFVTSLLQNLGMSSAGSYTSDKIVPNAAVPTNPQITNLNGLLSDIYVRFIQLKEDEFQLHYKVFTTVFNQLHQAMKSVDPYFNQYASDVKFAGSHYDRLRIKRADEFDMDIVVSLPLDYRPHREPQLSDLVLEAHGAGFVQLRGGRQFRNLPLRDKEQWLVNRTAYEWGDDAGYLLRSRFLSWFKSVLDRALGRHGPAFRVDGVEYSLRLSASGPAITLRVEGPRGFRLDVDYVPALKFPESRWPVSRHYRQVPPACRRGHWLLVPKADKSAGALEQGRMWRIALQDQERQLLNNLYNCKQVIRLVKKLRDAQKMNQIASYFVKTLFLWEVVERDEPEFWRRSPAELFILMVRKFYRALLDANIPYFWNRNNNLIAGINRATLDRYTAKLQKLLTVLDEPAQYKHVAKYLLTAEEFVPYNAAFLNI